jgi:hypothetical protein
MFIPTHKVLVPVREKCQKSSLENKTAFCGSWGNFPRKQTLISLLSYYHNFFCSKHFFPKHEKDVVGRNQLLFSLKMEWNLTAPYLPAGELPPLRIILSEMGTMLHDDINHEIHGVCQKTALNYASYFKEFNKSYVWSYDTSLVGGKKNGRYNGIIGKIIDDLGDVSLLPLPVLAVAPDVVENGPVLLSSPTVIVTVPSVFFSYDSVLYNLFRFNIEIVILLILAIFLFAVILMTSERNVSGNNQKAFKYFCEGVWKKIEIMLLQNNFNPTTPTGKLLLSITSIGIMFWYILWQNEMKADMSIMDTSQCVRNMGDLLQRNLTITLSSTDPSENLMASKALLDPSSNIAQVYKHATTITRHQTYRTRVPLLRSASQKMATLDVDRLKRSAFIYSDMMFTLLETMVCIVQPKLTFLVIPETFLESSFNSYVNPRYPTEWKKILFKRFVIIREMGLALKTWYDILRDSKEDAVQPYPVHLKSRRCIFHNVQSVVGQHELFIVLNSTHFKSSYVFLVIGCGISLIVFVIEKMRLIEYTTKKHQFLVLKVKNRK